MKASLSLRTLLITWALLGLTLGLIGRGYYLRWSAEQSLAPFVTDPNRCIGFGRGTVFHLSLSHKKVTEQELTEVSELAPNLTSLDLTNTGLNDEHLDCIRLFAELRSVHLGQNSISLEGILKLRHLPNLRAIYIDSRQLSEEECRSFRDLVQRIRLVVDYQSD